MRTTILLLGLPLLITGCANPSYEGYGEYLELPQVNVIERDLSPFLTANINQNKASTPEVAVMPNTTQSASTGKRYIIRNGETYRNGLRRWLKSEATTTSPGTYRTKPNSLWPKLPPTYLTAKER
ncbi:hypothetical protein JCM19239_6081 [Vibrio variabilis]|uniref:Lipoprotein n=1 Tax=Vibrio variabilis TaxID=990271 RepID=A0ABQ0JJR1_9VIBR|nr:hypothetical protein JCM19239_6081 [Vibrio variabilis]